MFMSLPYEPMPYTLSYTTENGMNIEYYNGKLEMIYRWVVKYK